MALNPKQQRFADEYLVDLNATQAAIRAGYSKSTAYSIGCENLIKPEIQKYLQEKRKQLAGQLNITQEGVLEGLRKLAFYDVRKFYNENNKLIDINQLDEETAFALTGFEVSEKKGDTRKIKLSDRRAAIDSICKVLGYNSPIKSEVTGKDGEAIVQPFSDKQVDEIIATLRTLNSDKTVINGK